VTNPENHAKNTVWLAGRWRELPVTPFSFGLNGLGLGLADPLAIGPELVGGRVQGRGVLQGGHGLIQPSAPLGLGREGQGFGQGGIGPLGPPADVGEVVGEPRRLQPGRGDVGRLPVPLGRQVGGCLGPQGGGPGQGGQVGPARPAEVDARPALLLARRADDLAVVTAAGAEPGLVGVDRRARRAPPVARGNVAGAQCAVRT
jgi:hypothetical protein